MQDVTIVLVDFVLTQFYIRQFPQLVASIVPAMPAILVFVDKLDLEFASSDSSDNKDLSIIECDACLQRASKLSKLVEDHFVRGTLDSYRGQALS